MYWVYVIKSKRNSALYFGSTPDLIKRLEKHNAGESRATAPYRPWVYAYVEGYAAKEDAFRREHNLKYFGKVYAQLKRRIAYSLRCA